jgi:hypothetical protein
MEDMVYMCKLSNLLTALAVLAIVAISCSSLASCRPVFDVDNTVNTTLVFNTTELGCNQDTVDLINSSVISYFRFWNSPGSCVLGTGVDILNISNLAKLGTAILTLKTFPMESRINVFSPTSSYRTESYVANTWNTRFNIISEDFNGSGTFNASMVVVNLTFHEGVVFNNSDNGTGVIVGTVFNVFANDSVVGGSTDVIGRLTLGDGTPVAGKLVRLIVANSSGGSVSFEAFTDGDGVVMRPFSNISSAGVFNVTGVFIGDEDFAGSNNSSTFNVVGLDPVPPIDNGTDTNGTVIDDGGVPGNGGSGMVDGPVVNSDFGLLGDAALPLTSVPLILLVSLLATMAVFVVGYRR